MTLQYMRMIKRSQNTFHYPSVSIYIKTFIFISRLTGKLLVLQVSYHLYITLLKALDSNTSGRVTAYDELRISSGICQGCQMSSSLFNLIIDVLLVVSLLSSEFTRIGLIKGDSLVC
ncbi:unnamed protein product [Heterobilharzia americana]|nr:unnamed protein product [Heterobilharzia americana]